MSKMQKPIQQSKRLGVHSIPVIRPVESSVDTPLWSVLIPVYNCFRFLPKTLQSVLDQDMGKDCMEIIVVDDCSTDGDVRGLVEKVGRGRVQYFCQPVNVGSLENFNTCLNISRGVFIHLLHGDDYVMNGYYEKCSFLFSAFPDAGASCCNIIYIDEEGKFTYREPLERPEDGLLADWLRKLSRRQHLQYCAVSVRRKVYEKLGGFYGVNYGEDWEMWTRIAASYPFVYTPEPLAVYRRHRASISGSHLHSGQHIEDIKWVVDTVQQYLPIAERATAKKFAYQSYARFTMAKAHSIWFHTHNYSAAYRKIKEAFSLSIGPYLLWRACLLIVRMALKL